MINKNPQAAHEENSSAWISGYVIQVGSFHNESYAIATKQRLLKAFNISVEIIYENNFFKVQVVSLKGINEAKETLQKLISNGFQQAFILKRIKR